MTLEHFIEYLESMKKHYILLSSHMEEEGQEIYSNEHQGRAKMLDYLLFLVKNNLFGDLTKTTEAPD